MIAALAAIKQSKTQHPGKYVLAQINCLTIQALKTILKNKAH